MDNHIGLMKPSYMKTSNIDSMMLIIIKIIYDNITFIIQSYVNI